MVQLYRFCICYIDPTKIKCIQIILYYTYSSMHTSIHLNMNSYFNFSIHSYNHTLNSPSIVFMHPFIVSSIFHTNFRVTHHSGLESTPFLAPLGPQEHPPLLPFWSAGVHHWRGREREASIILQQYLKSAVLLSFIIYPLILFMLMRQSI